MQVAGQGDEALTARLLAALEALWSGFTTNAELKLGLAVSGGPDSLALLVLAHDALLLPRSITDCAQKVPLKPPWSRKYAQRWG